MITVSGLVVAKIIKFEKPTIKFALTIMKHTWTGTLVKTGYEIITLKNRAMCQLKYLRISN